MADSKISGASLQITSEGTHAGEAVIIKHRKYGIWDYYEEQDATEVQSSIFVRLQALVSSYQDINFFLRMLKEVEDEMSSFRLRVGGSAVVQILLALVSAAKLWFYSQLLKVVRAGISHLDY
jgi:hypothetical protein